MSPTSYTFNQAVSQGVQGSFLALMTAFFLESLENMIPWLIVMFFVIVCDLVTGIRKVIKKNDKVRFSRAIRDTMGKMVTYTSFVVMVSLMNTAAGGEYDLDKWLCLFVCLIELCSIISNILQPHGYYLDFAGILNIIFKRISPDITSEDWHEAVKREKESMKERYDREESEYGNQDTH